MSALVGFALLIGSTAALHVGTLSRPGVRRSTNCFMGTATGADLCRSLQNGESPSELAEFVSTSAGVKELLASYLTEPEWTCAESAEQPTVLTQSLGSSDSSTVDVLLMNILNGAATSSEVQSRRACVLVNALWKGSPMLQDSCRALRDVVADKLGDKASVGWDQQFEFLKDEWSCIIGLMDYDNSALERILSALNECGGGEEQEEEE